MNTDPKQKDEELDPKPGSSAATDTGTSQAAAGSAPGVGTPPGYVSEESYKGLQRAAEKQKVKLESEIAAMREKLDTFATELEEAKMLSAEKSKLEAAQAELNTNLQKLQGEREQLARQLAHQAIIMSDFPALASLAAYIPSADTDDAFRANATRFSEALGHYVKSSVSVSFAGATPPIDGGNASADAGLTESLWDDVYRLAGVSGKEDEFREAYSKLQKQLQPK